MSIVNPKCYWWAHSSNWNIIYPPKSSGTLSRFKPRSLSISEETLIKVSCLNRRTK